MSFVPKAYASQIIRKNFFKDIVGCGEGFFRKHYGFKKAPDGRFGMLKHFNWNQRFAWANRKPGQGIGPHRRKAIFEGEFSAPTIWDLKSRPSSIGRGARGSFHILLYNPYSPEATDIRALQAHPANNGAAFQLASTFFGPLEGGMYNEKSELTNMTKHPVQGEEGSIATAPASIYRKYFMALDPQLKWFRNNKFYLLYALSHKLPMRFKSTGGAYVDATNYRVSKGDLDRVAVGIHHNILVTSGYGGRDAHSTQVRLSTMRNPQRITQIFTSAYDTRYLRGGEKAGYAIPLKRNVEQAAQMLLCGAYEGTIRAAAAKGVKRLYLTLVGGGSFRNKIKWIQKAIENTKTLIRDSGMTVILVYRPDKYRPKDKVKIRTADKDIAFLEGMNKLADDINGTRNYNQGTKFLIERYVTAFYNNQKLSSRDISDLQRLL